MNNIRSTLATVWRIAVPYFSSDDKWAGRALLAAVIAIELAMVGIDVLLNQWRNRFYNALQEQDWDSFVSEIGVFCVLATVLVALAVYQLYLNQWLQIRWRRWMTRQLSRRMAARRQPLPHAVAGRRRRQPRPAHHRRRQAVRRADAGRSGIGLLSSIVTLVSFVIILWGLSAAAPLHAVRQRFRHPRLSGVGRADLRHLRHRADAVDRLAAGPARFQAAALRGRFPLQPGAGARELRTDRAAAGRARRARAAVGSASTAWSRTGTAS